MRYDIKESIYKDPNLFRFLRENSSYYKRLNRGESLDNMINENLSNAQMLASISEEEIIYLLQ